MVNFVFTVERIQIFIMKFTKVESRTMKLTTVLDLIFGGLLLPKNYWFSAFKSAIKFNIMKTHSFNYQMIYIFIFQSFCR